ncbi:MAG: Siroheme synthase [Anaerolineae bacterium]|nr:Siroheme synthase [Anaerolineae bacterium]
MTNAATIYWIGAGPGDPGLITVKALALVQEADAIVGDVLDQARLLRHARPEAEIIDTGSRRTGDKMAQAQIERELLALGRRHKTVVRLWSGDPFVFGRAAQEMAAARQAGLRVAVVPGVTSAIAAPAYAGVPVTHWDVSASFAVVTGFLPDKIPVEPNWPALAQLETVIILMPLENLPEIVRRLLAAGRPAETPALVIENGTLPQQKQVLTTLAQLEEAVQAHAIATPAIVVLGQVARLSAELSWFEPENYPLLGKRVLVTRPIHQTADFMAELRDLGAEPVAFPTIEIRPVADTSGLDEVIRQLGHWAAAQREAADQPGPKPVDWLVLTSANGVAAFWERLQAQGLDSRSLAAVKIAAIGPATAAALARRSIVPDLVPPVYTAEGVLDAFDQLGSVAGQRFLLARADIARKTLAAGLADRGAEVLEIPAYRTVPVESGPTPPQADIVTFTSSSTVQGYVNCLKNTSPSAALAGSQVVCIGPITAQTARELGVPVAAVAKDYTIDGILNVLKGGDL